MENIMENVIKDLLSFLSDSASRFHASLEIQKRLDKAGFSCIQEDKPFKLHKGGKYYIRRMDTAIIAFVLGRKPLAKVGFNLAASHIDYPSLKLKTHCIRTDKSVTRCGVEVYGDPIINTWLDRDLRIAGKVMVKTPKGFQSEFIKLSKPIAIIPNAAIHLNREINEGFEYNNQKHLQAIIGVNDKGGNPLLEHIAKELKIKPEAIGETDIYLNDAIPAMLTGLTDELVTAQGLDNLAMTHAILSALITVDNPETTAVGVFFDHEEISSQTPQGAFSSLLTEILERICLTQSQIREDFYLAIRHSFLISADMAHAYHPSYDDKYDPDYSPYLNKGPVIKLNANYRYASSAESSQRFWSLCETAKVPCQKFLIRSDMIGGTTIGPIVAAQLGMHTVDIGNPIWAMHSIRETGGTLDHQYLIAVLKYYFV